MHQDPPALTRLLSTRLLAFDLVLFVPATLVWLGMVEPVNLGGVLVMCGVLFAARIVAWYLHLLALLRPVTIWSARGEDCSDDELLAAELTLRRVTLPHTIGYMLGWIAYVVGGSLLGYFLLPDVLRVSRVDLVSIAFYALAMVVGAPLIVSPLMQHYCRPVLERLREALEQRGQTAPRRRVPLLRRLGVHAFGLVLAPLFLMAATAWSAEIRGLRLRDQAANVDIWAQHFWVVFAPSFIAVLLWASFVIFMFTRTLTEPIDRLRASISRLVEVGDLGAMSRIPVFEDDEIGELTRDFNALLASLGRLSATAQTLASGKLDVELEGEGEIADAFRSMVTQLHAMVVEIRRVSLSLASAASEIQAATREQERASEQQAAGMRELSETMDSLARSAAQISAAVADVRANAQSTFVTTDDMASKLAELDARGRGVSELLDVIREIADRSDILALNGSLEATRAGEAGRGFALVAGEMRRLAERVTGTVADVKLLVVDIAGASTGTIEATTRSRSLAESTTNAARRIADETERQSSDTQRVSEGVRELATVVAHTSAATTQTRAAAEDMREQAEQLQRMIGRFDVRAD